MTKSTVKKITKKEMIETIQRNKNITDESVLKTLKEKNHASLLEEYIICLKETPVKAETAIEIIIPETAKEKAKKEKAAKEKAAKVEIYWKEKRGWKTKLIKMLFSQVGGRIKRTTLAGMIKSDEKNTHILISCIKRSTDFGAQEITWDKEKKMYNF